MSVRFEQVEPVDETESRRPGFFMQTLGGAFKFWLCSCSSTGETPSILKVTTDIWKHVINLGIET